MSTPTTWTATDGGSVQSAADADHPHATALTSGSPSVFGRFRPSPVPTLDGDRIRFAIKGSDYHLVYIETRTSAGRRVYKFNPVAQEPSFRFGYRYELGLGSESRDGAWHTYDFDLAQIAASLEPGVSILELTEVTARVPGTMTIDVIAPDAPRPETDELTRSDAVRFLNQATFGARTAEIDELLERGSLQGWIDDQYALPTSTTLSYVQETSNGSYRNARHMVWWRNVMEGRDQLRQRVAFALSEIFVISDLDYELGNNQYGVSDWYDMLAGYADGNFRDLLTDITLHPVMGIYLSMMRNEKADPARNIRPDENYARELLQLFSIGLYELDDRGQPVIEGGAPRPTYDQETIEEFARVFTGWNWNGETSFTSNNLTTEQRRLPMTPVESFHDTGSKTLLNGQVLPAGQTARQDLDAALDNVFAHRNVGPFIAKALIQRLVTSNPSSGYVSRVAAAFNNNGSGERGDLRATVTAILLDQEARTGHQTNTANFGKVKEPLLRLSQMWRALDATPGPANPDTYRPYSVSLMLALPDVIGQAPLMSPSVFNFFSPSYRPATGGLTAPEMQIYTEVLIAATNNMLHSSIYDHNNIEPGNDRVTRVTLDRAYALADDADRLADHLNVLLFGGTMPRWLRDPLVEHVSSLPTDADGLYARTVDAIYLCIASPAFIVQI